MLPQARQHELKRGVVVEGDSVATAPVERPLGGLALGGAANEASPVLLKTDYVNGLLATGYKIHEALSPDQNKMAVLAGAGFTYVEIGALLGCSEHVVGNKMSAVYKILNTVGIKRKRDISAALPDDFWERVRQAPKQPIEAWVNETSLSREEFDQTLGFDGPKLGQIIRPLVERALEVIDQKFEVSKQGTPYQVVPSTVNQTPAFKKLVEEGLIELGSNGRPKFDNLTLTEYVMLSLASVDRRMLDFMTWGPNKDPITKIVADEVVRFIFAKTLQ